MKKCFYLLTILGLLLQPGLASLYGAAAQVGGDEPQSPADVTLFVKPAPTGTGDCTSWANACGLQAALTAAEAGDEIWVAAGVYYPGSTGERQATFLLKNGVAIYGGFAGTETNREHRDWVTYVTTLNGDIGVAGDTSDNSYHVVTGSGTDGTAILDGFTITLGNANGSSPWDSGGGLYNNIGSPSITNVSFSGNHAGMSGGGMFNLDGSQPSLVNVTFSGNASSNHGGGLYNWNSSPTITNVTFNGNNATWAGGGMYNNNSSPTITNVTFSGNTAVDGGGIANDNSSPTITNVTFSANTAAWYGGGMYNDNSSPTITNAILWGNTPDQIFNASGAPVVSYSDVQGGYSGVGNIDADPLFVNAAGGNLRLQLTSPAIDAGNNAAVPAGVLTDLDGKPRFVDIPGVRDPGAIVDMGAYEAQNVVYLPLLRK